MNINKLFENKKYLQQEYEYYLQHNQLRRIQTNPQLTQAHLTKAKHNLAFHNKNTDNNKFLDWLIITLYYALYHAALALITNKKHTSKNHYATILVLIKEYAITQEEAQLLNELAINKQDAQLYTQLKQEREKASYHTTTAFTHKQVHNYRQQTIAFINKTQEILHKETNT